MIEYSEKLRPSVGVYLVVALTIPFFTLTLAPFSLPLGLSVGLLVFSGIAISLHVTSPRIAVTTTTLRAGKAVIERAFVGSVSAYSGDAAREQRGVKLDARAWMLFRGFIDPVVKVTLTDSSDPTPYWLISTRNPQKLAHVLRAGRKSRE